MSEVTRLKRLLVLLQSAAAARPVATTPFGAPPRSDVVPPTFAEMMRVADEREARRKARRRHGLRVLAATGQEREASAG